MKNCKSKIGQHQSEHQIMFQGNKVRQVIRNNKDGYCELEVDDEVVNQLTKNECNCNIEVRREI